MVPEMLIILLFHLSCDLCRYCSHELLVLKFYKKGKVEDIKFSFSDAIIFYNRNSEVRS